MRAALLLPVLLAGPIAAEPRAPDTIEVIGRKPEEVRKEAQDFVRKLKVTERPVARFVDPVCPDALGVPEKIAARVEARVRAVAKGAGARVAPPGCKPNLVIAFADKTDGVVERVAKRMPGRADAIRTGVWEELRASPAPIRWWHLTADRTGDGSPGMGGDMPPSMGGFASSTEGVQMGGRVYQHYKPSLTSTQMVRVLAASSVIVDVDRATGMPLDSVIDYAALVGLAEIRFGEEPPPGSVLGLFAPEGPRELTTLDLNFLRTLYKLPLDRTAMTHRGLLVRGLMKGEADKADD